MAVLSSPAAILGAVSLAIWIYLLAARGGFWRMRETAAPQLKPEASGRRVAVVIPARDEAAAIGQALSSLLRQQYPGELSVFLVDDHSSDDTAEIARATNDRVCVIEAGPLPTGWTGKLWAVSEGLARAASIDPDYYLLTDADIVHTPENVAGLVARAETDGLDLVSYMVKLQCRTTAERALIPAFVFFFFLLYPPAWIARRDHRTAGAAGGCMLIRSSALARIGGIAAIRGELIDDCALARAIKRNGGKVWLGLTASTRSIRDYETFAEMGNMISRSAFTQLHHSSPMLAGAIAGLAITYAVPPLLLLTAGPGKWLGGAAWLLMTAAYLPAIRFYGCSILWAPLLPAITLFYAGATVHSAVTYWSGRGGMWKGRAQDAR